MADTNTGVTTVSVAGKKEEARIRFLLDLLFSPLFILDSYDTS